MVHELKLLSENISTELIDLRKRTAMRYWCVMPMSYVTLSAGEWWECLYYSEMSVEQRLD